MTCPSAFDRKNFPAGDHIFRRCRVRGGRIVEHWGEADTVGMLIQMGVDPFAGSEGPR